MLLPSCLLRKIRSWWHFGANFINVWLQNQLFLFVNLRLGATNLLAEFYLRQMLANFSWIQNKNIAFHIIVRINFFLISTKHFVECHNVSWFILDIRLVVASLGHFSVPSSDMLFKQFLECLSVFKFLLSLSTACHIDVTLEKLLSHSV